MKELGFQRAQVLWSFSRKEGSHREENCGRRTVGVDMKDITGFQSAAILHNAKLHKRFFIAPKWEIYRL